MKKQGMGGSAFFVGVGWLGLPAGAVCRSPMYLHEKEYYTAFLWVAIIKRKGLPTRNSQERSVVVRRALLNRCPATHDHPQPEKEFRPKALLSYYNNPKERGTHK